MYLILYRTTVLVASWSKELILIKVSDYVRTTSHDAFLPLHVRGPPVLMTSTMYSVLSVLTMSMPKFTLSEILNFLVLRAADVLSIGSCHFYTTCDDDMTHNDLQLSPFKVPVIRAFLTGFIFSTIPYEIHFISHAAEQFVKLSFLLERALMSLV